MVTCEVCSSPVVLKTPNNETDVFNVLVNHMFVEHTWPHIEEMLREHARDK